MKIQTKLSILIGAAISSQALITGASWTGIDQLKSLSNTEVMVSELDSTLLQLRRHEKDFFARMDAKYKAKIKERVGEFNSQLRTLISDAERLGLDVHGDELAEAIGNYENDMLSIIDYYQRVGLSFDDGEYAKFFQRLDNLVESVEDENSKSDLAYGGRLVRLYAITGDTSYLREFDEKVSSLPADLKESQELLALEEHLSKLVYMRSSIGNSPKEGLHGKIRKSAHILEAELNTLLEGVAAESVELEGEIKQMLAGVVAFTSLFFVLGFFVTARYISRRIKAVEKGILYVHDSKDLGYKLDDKGDDELAGVAKSFNELMGELRDVTVGIVNSSNHLDTASNQLISNSSEVQESFSRQQDQLSTVVAAIEEMVATVSGIAQSASNSASLAAQTQDSAHNGLSGVERTYNEIKRLSANLNNSIDEARALSMLSENIDQVLDVIVGIAEQTNLLALNAAIEAARAGDQGRGFAVVADEVRGLAHRTQSSAQEISELIDTIKGKTAAVVGNIENCTVDGINAADQAKETLTGMADIIEQMSGVIDSTQEIAAAVEQQNVACQEVSSSAQNVYTDVENASSLTEQTSEVAKSIEGESENLKSSVSELLSK